MIEADSSLDGLSTTRPELRRLYGRGLEGVISVGLPIAVGCTRGVYAQFAGTLGIY